MKCPTCGHFWDKQRPFVQQRWLCHNGERIKLNPQEAAVLKLLTAYFGQAVPAERLRIASNASEGSNVMQKLISRLRPRLKKLGLYIEAVYGEGYVLFEVREE